ncbi:MAG: copper-binding protein [Betaproteobacteria bacterium]|nr:copper-binding protein [Betaproteobacteria bacterium]
MNPLKSLLVPALFAAATLIAVSGVARAQADHSKMDHGKMDMAKDVADGEVRKVDKDAAKVTIKHGEIKNLDMPPMTMVFQVKDKALLDTVKAGDKVRFKAISDNGKLFVTEIHPGKQDGASGSRQSR